MKKILAFGASNSSTSINQKLARFASAQVADSVTTLLDLKEFEMPLYSIDRQNESGFPQEATHFHALIKEHDGIIVSLAEHNHSYSAVFKNLIDWVSRIDGKFWQEKPILLLSTSPGARGAANVMDAASRFFPFAGGKVVSSFSLPQFYENFTEDGGISDPELRDSFEGALILFAEALAQ